MALHPDFPESPYAVVDPAVRWFRADENLREALSDKLMPPLVSQLRRRVKVPQKEFEKLQAEDMVDVITAFA